MGTRYPGTLFFDYHRSFAAKAASFLDQRNIRVDWSVRDVLLFTEVFSGCKAHACEICHSTIHTTGFCPQKAKEKPHPRRCTILITNARQDEEVAQLVRNVFQL